MRLKCEVCNLIIEAGWRDFAPLAPVVEEGPKYPLDLHSDLNPETFCFDLVAIDGETTTKQTPTPRKVNVYLHPDIISNSLHLPRYPSKEVTVLNNLPCGFGYIAEVEIKNQQMCCKITTERSRKAVEREYQCLQKISNSKYDSSIRAPRLVGLVTDDSDGRIEGGIASISLERRGKWTTQITETVGRLHDIDVIWGDAKPENVLIDSGNDDCYLVDFGGSWTDGWVDEMLKETREGDKQALERILKFLDV